MLIMPLASIVLGRQAGATTWTLPDGGRVGFIGVVDRMSGRAWGPDGKPLADFPKMAPDLLVSGSSGKRDPRFPQVRSVRIWCIPAKGSTPTILARPANIWGATNLSPDRAVAGRWLFSAEALFPGSETPPASAKIRLGVAAGAWKVSSRKYKSMVLKAVSAQARNMPSNVSTVSVQIAKPAADESYSFVAYNRRGQKLRAGPWGNLNSDGSPSSFTFYGKAQELGRIELQSRRIKWIDLSVPLRAKGAK